MLCSCCLQQIMTIQSSAFAHPHGWSSVGLMQVIWLLNTYFNEFAMYHSSEIMMKLMKLSYLWVH